MIDEFKQKLSTCEVVTGLPQPHHFWKDRNPPQCLNCGRTEEEILDKVLSAQL